MKAWTCSITFVLVALQKYTDASQSAQIWNPQHGRINPQGSGSSCADWTSWMPPRVYPAVIMQVVTRTYVDVERNFIEHMEANSDFTRYNLYVICMDSESVEETKLMGFRCVPLDTPPNEGRPNEENWKALFPTWKLRSRVVSCLLSGGYDVIVSDADAVWIKDPMLDLESPQVRESGIVASRGLFPFELGDRWGSTMCMGFIFFRAGTQMEVFQGLMQRLVAETGDDQVAINAAADYLGIVWDDSGDMRFKQSTGYGRGVIKNLTRSDFYVTLLPQNSYTRTCDAVPINNETVVAHCKSPKTDIAKTAWMKKAGLWLVYER